MEIGRLIVAFMIEDCVCMKTVPLVYSHIQEVNLIFLDVMCVSNVWIELVEEVHDPGQIRRYIRVYDEYVIEVSSPVQGFGYPSLENVVI
jgi:hypothetical protein